MRYYYFKDIEKFLLEDNNEIVGEIVRRNEFDLKENQRDAWIFQIKMLKDILINKKNGYIIFEYTIPRMGKRIDNILVIDDVIFLIEFKVWEKKYNKSDIDQVLDYALDLKNFHLESHNKIIVPILLATDAGKIENNIELYADNIVKPLLCNKENLIIEIDRVLNYINIKGENFKININIKDWINSNYKPTPTIIEAAQRLYSDHSVKEISRSDAGFKNLSKTTNYINSVIDKSKINNEKSICFITGVPGAGKTLAGLNISTSRQNYKEEEHAVFLSGNGPLVKVLQEALARDEKDRKEIKISDARREVKSFIQNVHNFRDDALNNEDAPIEKVVIFDEAQRAWNLEQTSKFMKKKKGRDLNVSEPEFLIGTMNRHKDWTVIICLIGEGQEINTGEAGIDEWFRSLKIFDDWNIYISKNINAYHDFNIKKAIDNSRLTYSDDLHLNVSIRSFRSESLSKLIENILDLKKEEAKNLYLELKNNYPIFITRDIQKAKNKIKKLARGTERYGIIASSGARRLKAVGYDVKNEIDEMNWFLNSKDDVRSSYFLEDVATEFDIQGLELDFSIVFWGADFRYNKNGWIYKDFKGTKWQNINNVVNKEYRKNAYRVLLTRARQSMVICVPHGDKNDNTRLDEYYDETYDYLKSIGFEEL